INLIEHFVSSTLFFTLCSIVLYSAKQQFSPGFLFWNDLMQSCIKGADIFQNLSIHVPEYKFSSNLVSHWAHRSNHSFFVFLTCLLDILPSSLPEVSTFWSLIFPHCISNDLTGSIIFYASVHFKY